MPPADPAAPGPFPATRYSLVAAVRAGGEERRRALEALAAAYRPAVHAYLRLRWRLSPEDADDAAQTFFVRSLERGFWEGYDPARARLRTWLRVHLDRQVVDARRAAGRLRRGGGAVHLPLDEAEADGVAATGEDPDDLFHREWVRALLEDAVGRLRDECRAAGREARWELFRRYDLEPHPDGARPTYADLARETGLPVTGVTNHLAAARRRFRALVLEALREQTGSPEELRAEARALLGVEP